MVPSSLPSSPSSGVVTGHFLSVEVYRALKRIDSFGLYNFGRLWEQLLIGIDRYDGDKLKELKRIYILGNIK